MKKIEFSFIKDAVLRENIENVYNDVFELFPMIAYTKPEIEHCLRKTIIIYTASIIEALLLWKIEKELGTGKVVLSNEIKYFDPKKVYEAEDFDLFVVKGKAEIKKLNELDFNRMIGVCESHKILKNKKLADALHKVRKLRNKLHIGGLRTVTKTYPQKEVEFVLEVLEKVIQSVKP